MRFDLNRRLIGLVVAIAGAQTLLVLVAFVGATGTAAPLLAPAETSSQPATVLTDRVAPEQTSGSFGSRLLLGIAMTGTVAAWAVVILVMLRVFAGQRELVRLQRRFVADISHELKTPLALVRMLAETLRDGRVRDPQRVREYHASITREAERLSGLLENILDYSSIESGQKRYDFADCDVADVARQAWSLFEPQFDADGFQRELDIAPDLPTIHGDPTALGQMVINLLQNAHRYSGDARFVRMSVGREPENVVITIEDHGIGMSKAQLQRLGDSFYRAPDPRVRKSRGTGLGHAIIKHIVAAHGGRLGVYSHPSLGSTFVVRLPIPESGESGGPSRA